MSDTLPPFFDMIYTTKEGRLTPEASLYQDQTFQVLNNIITQFGLNVPSFTTAQVAAFPANVPPGTIWFNSSLNKLQFKGNLANQTITSV